MSLILKHLLQQLKAKTSKQLRQSTSSCPWKRHLSCPAAAFVFPSTVLEERHRNFPAAGGGACLGPEKAGASGKTGKAHPQREGSPISRARAGRKSSLASPLTVPPLTAAYGRRPRSPRGCGHRPRHADLRVRAPRGLCRPGPGPASVPREYVSRPRSWESPQGSVPVGLGTSTEISPRDLWDVGPVISRRS